MPATIVGRCQKFEFRRVPAEVVPLVSALAVAVGEDAVWVLLGQGTLLRVDPDRHRVTGRLELGAPTGPLAVGAGAVWVGNGQATVTARVDPVRLRVTARFGGYVVAVAHGVLWSYCCRRGYQPMGFSRIDARTLRPRPPLVVTDASGRRQPVGRLAVGTDAVWTQTSEDERLWRVPLGGGPARAVVGVPGTGYGLAADAGAAWVLRSGCEAGPPISWRTLTSSSMTRRQLRSASSCRPRSCGRCCSPIRTNRGSITHRTTCSCTSCCSAWSPSTPTKAAHGNGWRARSTPRCPRRSRCR